MAPRPDSGRIQINPLTLPLPKGWEEGSTMVIVRGPAEAGFRPNLVFEQMPTRPGQDAAAFARLQQMLSAASGEHDVLVKEGPATFGPNSGFLREITSTDRKNAIHQLTFYVVAHDRAYIFTFSNGESYFAASRALAEKLFADARLNVPQRRQREGLAFKAREALRIQPCATCLCSSRPPPSSGPRVA